MWGAADKAMLVQISEECVTDRHVHCSCCQLLKQDSAHRVSYLLGLGEDPAGKETRALGARQPVDRSWHRHWAKTDKPEQRRRTGSLLPLLRAIWGQVLWTENLIMHSENSTYVARQVSLAVFRTCHFEISAGTAFSLRLYAIFLRHCGQMSAELPFVPSKCPSTHHSPNTTPYIYICTKAHILKFFLCICATDVQ